MYAEQRQGRRGWGGGGQHTAGSMQTEGCMCAWAQAAAGGESKLRVWVSSLGGLGWGLSC